MTPALTLSFYRFSVFLLSASVFRLFLFSHFLSFVCLFLSSLVYLIVLSLFLSPSIIYLSLFISFSVTLFSNLWIRKNVMKIHRCMWGYRMIRHRQIPISMPDNSKPIVVKCRLFTEVWNLKSAWFFFCTENGAEGF